MVDFRWRQEAEEMAEEKSEDAEMEQDAAPDELLAPEKLARLGAPGVLAAIEACPASEEEARHADIGKHAEPEVINVVHDADPYSPYRGSSYRAPGGAHRSTNAAPAAQPAPGEASPLAEGRGVRG